MVGSNRMLLACASAAVALIVGITFWSARDRPTQYPSDASTVHEIPQPVTMREASTADPSYADVWAGRARPPMPKRGTDGKLGLLMGGPEERARAKREYEQLASKLEEAHRKQPIDAAWKGVAETSMRNIQDGEALKTTGFTPQDFRSDCRSQSCRISATFDRGADAQDWATMFTTMTGAEFRSARYVTLPTADGKTEIRIYGNRR